MYTVDFLAEGQTTPNGWNRMEYHIPADAKFTEIGTTNRAMLKTLDRTRIAAKLNPETSKVAFDVPPVEDSKAGSLPVVSQAFIDSRIQAI